MYKKGLDILGYKLEDGLSILKEYSYNNYRIIETKSKKIDESLLEKRILKVVEKEDTIEITIGYF